MLFVTISYPKGVNTLLDHDLNAVEISKGLLS